jgi:hypothetical protein
LKEDKQRTQKHIKMMTYSTNQQNSKTARKNQEHEFETKRKGTKLKG